MEKKYRRIPPLSANPIRKRKPTKPNVLTPSVNSSTSSTSAALWRWKKAQSKWRSRNINNHCQNSCNHLQQTMQKKQKNLPFPGWNLSWSQELQTPALLRRTEKKIAHMNITFHTKQKTTKQNIPSRYKTEWYYPWPSLYRVQEKTTKTNKKVKQSRYFFILKMLGKHTRNYRHNTVKVYSDLNKSNKASSLKNLFWSSSNEPPGFRSSATVSPAETPDHEHNRHKHQLCSHLTASAFTDQITPRDKRHNWNIIFKFNFTTGDF